MTAKTAVDSSEQQNDEEFPTWLHNLVKLGQFYRPCESHVSKFCNLYCMDCMGVAICPKCRDQHMKYGCKILTAYKASREAALRIVDLRSIWDISDICVYIINRKQIVFIQTKGGEGRRGSSHGDERCQNCSYNIRSPSKYCSVECKVDAVQRRLGANTNMAVKRKSVEEADAGAASTTDKSGMPKSYRKRPRKGIPCRAPFF